MLINLLITQFNHQNINSSSSFDYGALYGILILLSPVIVLYIFYLYHSYCFKKYGHYYFKECYKNLLELKRKNQNKNNY